MSWNVEERQRFTDVQTKYIRVGANDHNGGVNHVILQGKNDSSILLDHPSRRLPFREEILQFRTTANQQQTESTLDYRGKVRNRDRFNELTFTGSHSIPFHSSGLFLVSNSYLIVTSKRFSYHPERDFGSSSDLFDHDKRLRSPGRVQSRSRGTRIMPYAHRGSECRSGRAPALGENAFCSCVFDSSSQRWGRHSKADEGIRRRSMAD